MENLQTDLLLIEKELTLSYERYLHIYFTERNYEKIKAVLHPNVCGIGAAENNFAISHNEVLTLFAIDLLRHSSPIEYNIVSIKTVAISETSGFTMGKIKFIIPINNDEFEILHFRITAVFTKVDNIWQIIHIHKSEGQDNFQSGEIFPLKELSRKNKALEKTIDERTQELTTALKRLEITAITDSLTGLFNRHKFNELISYEIDKAKRNNKPLSIILGDIDNFKQVNDKFGHLVGDDVLKFISNIMKQNIRDTDILIRWGGEEFIILMSNTVLSDAFNTAERIRQIIEQSSNKHNISLTISFGVSEFSSEDSEDSLINKVDLALYKAKRRGRNRVEI